MKTTLSKLILMPVFLLLVSCESMDGSIYTADHPVVTIDRSQVNALINIHISMIGKHRAFDSSDRRSMPRL